MVWAGLDLGGSFLICSCRREEETSSSSEGRGNSALFLRDLGASLLKASFFVGQRVSMFLPDTAWLHLQPHRLPSAHSGFASATLARPPTLAHQSPLPPFSPGPSPSWCPFLPPIWLRPPACHINHSPIRKASSLALLSTYCVSWNNVSPSVEPSTLPGMMGKNLSPILVI